MNAKNFGKASNGVGCKFRVSFIPKKQMSNNLLLLMLMRDKPRSECEAGGVIPAGNGIHNLLWDRENKQWYVEHSNLAQPSLTHPRFRITDFAINQLISYIVDYGRWCPTEEYRRPDPGSGWRDSLFNTWGLRVFAQGGRWKP